MTETKDQRTGWLKDLKAGDTVLIVRSKGILGSQHEATIEKVTPTGRIKVGGLQFPPSGVIYKDCWITRLEATKETEQA